MKKDRSFNPHSFRKGIALVGLLPGVALSTYACMPVDDRMGPVERTGEAESALTGGDHVIAVVDAAGVVDSAYTYNPLGAVTADTSGNGHYNVHLEGLAVGVAEQGNTQVVAVGSDAVRCKSFGLDTDGTTNLIVRIRCRDATGTMTPSRFVLYYERETAMSTGESAHALANRPTKEYYHIEAERSWNSTGGLNWVSRGGTGEYFVTLSNLAQLAGNTQVMAMGKHNGHHCMVDASGRPSATVCAGGELVETGDQLLTVYCFDDNGDRVDEKFQLNYHGADSLPIHGHGAYAWVQDPGLQSLYAYTSVCGGTSFVDYVTTGVYRVNHSGLSAGEGIPLVTATTGTGTDPRYCKIASWVPGSSGGVDVTVHCFDSFGAAADAVFTEMFITAGLPPTCP